MTTGWSNSRPPLRYVTFMFRHPSRSRRSDEFAETSTCSLKKMAMTRSYASPAEGVTAKAPEMMLRNAGFTSSVPAEAAAMQRFVILLPCSANAHCCYSQRCVELLQTRRALLQPSTRRRRIWSQPRHVASCRQYRRGNIPAVYKPTVCRAAQRPYRLPLSRRCMSTGE